MRAARSGYDWQLAARSTIHFQQLDHAEVADLLEEITLDFADSIHFENNFGNGLRSLITRRAKGLFNDGNVERAHAELFESHAEQHERAEWISGHFTAHADTFP